MESHLRVLLPKLFAVAALLPLGACDNEQIEQADVVRQVRAIEVGSEASIGRAWFPGRAKAVQEVELAFRVGGQLASLPIEVGDEVAKGDILAQLDAVSYETEVQRLDATQASAEAKLENLELNLARQEKLLENEFAAEQRVDTLRSQVRQAGADIKAIAAGKRQGGDRLGAYHAPSPVRRPGGCEICRQLSGGAEKNSRW